MSYEGTFVIVMLVYVVLSVVIFAYQYISINSKIDYDDHDLMETFIDTSSLQEHCKAVQLVLDQLKYEPKQSKYTQLKFNDKIKDCFIFN